MSEYRFHLIPHIPDEAVTNSIPGVDTSGKDLDVPAAFFYVFCCHTGSGRFPGSDSVKDDSLIPAQFWEFGLEFVKRNRPFEVHLSEPRFILVGTDAEKCTRF
jgi:hypothetical protein